MGVATDSCEHAHDADGGPLRPPIGATPTKMPSFEQPTTPVWATAHELPPASPLDADVQTEICVVGAGVGGLTTALLLAREGRRVVVLDADRPGGGESSRTTAHLANAVDDRYQNLVRWHGRQGALLAAQSHRAAIGRVEQFVEELGLQCDFRRVGGFLFAADSSREAELDAEFEAAREAGLADTEFCEWPGREDGPRCLRFPRQAQISPWPYLRGLAEEITRLGGRIHGDTRVTDIREGAEVLVKTARGFDVRAGAVVVATNSPVNDRFAMHTKIAAYRTFVTAFRVPAGAVPAGLYWDNANPCHYARLAPAPDGDGELLIVGGEDCKTGQDSEARLRFDRLTRWTRAHFPAAGQEPPVHCWSGQVMETIDGLAYLGRNPGLHDNAYIITGDSGMGMTHGTLGGMIITDLIQGRANPWAALYDPSRKTLRAAVPYARENLNVALQYLDLGRRAAHDDPDAVPLGAGRVARDGVQKIVLCRDALDRLHRRSAVCPHLGCIVAWNPVEHSLDCPSPGSRFAANGRVLNGPALTDLPVAS
jgi:glycine/D-amino acid oxidase-like deaminating enzyme